MEILTYFKTLLNVFPKAQLTEDLRITLAELDTTAVPVYQSAVEFFKVTKIQSAEGKRLSSDFYRNVDMNGAAKQSSVVAEIARRLPFIRENAEYVSKQIDALMGRDVIREGLNAKQASFIRSAEAISFISRFSLDFLNYIYMSEALEVSSELKDSLRLSPATIKHVQLNTTRFFKLISDYGIPHKDFIKLYEKIPEVSIGNNNANGVKAMFSAVELDPFKNSLMSNFVGNPIYHIRMQIAEWQANRYKANKDKKKVLELRLLHLKTLNEKENNPAIEKEIIYTQSRIDRLDRYLAEVEEDLDLK